MTDKLSNVLAQIELALADLVGASHVRAVYRRALTPKEPMLPCVGLLGMRASRDNSVWEMDVALQVRLVGDGRADDAAVIEIMAAADDCITALIDSGTAGGRINRPVWDFWYAYRKANQYDLVGCAATLRVAVEDPITID